MNHFDSSNRFAELDRMIASRKITAGGTPRAQGRSVGAKQPEAQTSDLIEAGDRARTRCWPWPGMIFVLLAINIAIVFTMIYAATSDQSFAVEPDYYRKAVEWDRSAAQRAHNAELGWSVRLAAAPVGSPIAVRLVDRQSQDIAGARLEVVAFHNAHANHRLETVLHEIEPGLYRSNEVLMRPGAWELRFTASIGDSIFTQTATHLVKESHQ